MAPAAALLLQGVGCLFSSSRSLVSSGRGANPLAAGSCSSHHPWQEQPAHMDLAAVIWGTSESPGPPAATQAAPPCEAGDGGRLCLQPYGLI